MRTQRDIIQVIDQHERDIKRLRATLARTPNSAAVDHGGVTGLGDDDHTQYHTDARGDARYLRIIGGTVSGALTVTGTTTVPNGTAAAPGVRLTSSAHGLYRYDANNVGLAANGGAAIIASQSGVTVMGDYLYFNGTTATEYIQFLDVSNYARIVLDGGEVFRVNTSGQVMGGAGSSGAPTHSWIVDPNTGFFRAAENNIGVALGGASRAAFQVPTANGSAGLLGGGTLLVGATSLDVLGSTAGNIQRRASFYFDVGGNNAGLEVQAVRDAAGGDWTTAALGIRRITDATSQSSLWWYQSRIGINKSGPQWTLEVAGTFGCAPSTTTTSGFIAHWHAGSGSSYQLYRYTSSKRYKKDIDYDTDWLADLELKPTTFLGATIDGETGETTWAPSISFIAEDAEALDERLAVFDDKGRVSNFDDRGYIAILAAKDRRKDKKIASLEERIEALEKAVATLV